MSQALHDTIESYSAIGVTLDTVVSGDSVYVATSGQVNVLLEQQVTSDDIGKRIFLSSVNPGKGTLIPPSGFSQSVVSIGRLLTSDSNSFMQECMLNIEHIAHIG